MSRTFYVNPGPGHQPMTVGDALGLVTFPLTVPDATPEQLPQVEAMSTDGLVFHFGDLGRCARGFEFAFEEGQYNVRVMTPSVPGDWEAALEFLAALSRHLGGVEIIDEEGGRFTPDSVTDFQYTNDILFGIQVFGAEALKGEGALTLTGMLRSLHMDARMAQHFLEAEDPIAEFDRIFGGLQRLDAFDATPIIYNDGDQIRGVYALTSDVRTVLPAHYPSAHPAGYDLGGRQVADYRVEFIQSGVDPEGSDFLELGAIDYQDFLNSLAQNQFYVLDAATILVELSADEMFKMLGRP